MDAGKRRPHRKSQFGCMGCRRRRVKCQETLPACAHCVKRGEECIYPRRPHLLAASDAGTPAPSLTPSSSIRAPDAHAISSASAALLAGGAASASFSLNDMRLFNHFITSAHPHFPEGNDDTWSGHIVSLALAEENSFLMHAMLACAGSHMNANSPNSEKEAALNHRVIAMAGVSQAFQSTPKSNTEADVLLAACYILSMQSLYLEDGLHDYLVMIRGCGLIFHDMWAAGFVSTFRHLNRIKDHESFKMQRWTGCEVPQPELDLFDGMIDSIDLLHMACEHRGWSSLCTLLRPVAEALPEKPLQALLLAGRTWSAFAAMSSEDFNSLLNPDDGTAKALLAHWLATLLVTSPLEALDQFKQRTVLGVAFREWLRQLIHGADAHLMEWPLRVAEMWDSKADWWFGNSCLQIREFLACT